MPRAPREAAARAAARAVRRARRRAERAGVDLSDWEADFLTSVEARIRTFGRAFADPDKGAYGAALSAMQARKIREIEAKVRAERRTEGVAEPD